MRLSILILSLGMVLISCQSADQTKSSKDKITFLDNYEEFRSFEEIIEPLQGNVLLVDLWATWCGPCKNEFRYKSDLHEFIKDKDIEVVYISYDRPNQVDKWKSFIGQNELTGYHAFAWPPIQTEIRNRFARERNGRKGILLPTYIIIDREGQVVNRNAPRPSSKERLYSELQKYL